jgi:RNA polymerase sigma-70 factor (ECF subfamily)
MHDERFADDEQDDRSSPEAASPAGGPSGDSLPGESQPSSAPEEPANGAPLDEDSGWIEPARTEATRKRTPREFIDKKGSSKTGPHPAAHEPTDESLFLRYQQGDDTAFVAIYERYKTNIYAYCAHVLLSVGLPRELVEDTFQDVFLRLAQYRQTFTGGEFKAWIFTVTRHSCLSSKKKAFHHRATTETVGDGENFENNVSSEVRAAFTRIDDPLDRMSRAEQTDLLMKAIAKLPEEFREALLMSEYEGLTYEEIGMITGTSLSTIRIRIFRAKARLRKMLLPIIGNEADSLTQEKEF